MCVFKKERQKIIVCADAKTAFDIHCWISKHKEEIILYHNVRTSHNKTAGATMTTHTHIPITSSPALNKWKYFNNSQQRCEK